MCTEFKKNEIMEIDLHGYDVSAAKRLLERTVISAPHNIREIIVIHGYHSGNDMMNMVRKQFKCRRVERKIISMNPGITSLILK